MSLQTPLQSSWNDRVVYTFPGLTGGSGGTRGPTGATGSPGPTGDPGITGAPGLTNGEPFYLWPSIPSADVSGAYVLSVTREIATTTQSAPITAIATVIGKYVTEIGVPSVSYVAAGTFSYSIYAYTSNPSNTASLGACFIIYDADGVTAVVYGPTSFVAVKSTNPFSPTLCTFTTTLPDTIPTTISNRIGVNISVYDTVLAGNTITVMGGGNTPSLVTTSVALTSGGGTTGPTGCTGPANGNLPIATNFGDYLYWNTTSNAYVVGDSKISLGGHAGESNQGNYGVAVGSSAGNVNQAEKTVAIGYYAGLTNQAQWCVAVGNEAGKDTQGQQAVAVGIDAGQSNQGAFGVAVGAGAGASNQGGFTLALGSQAGRVSQGGYATAIGTSAAYTGQGQYAVAIGANAGYTNQQQASVAIGAYAGNATQGADAVAIGNAAGNTNQGTSCVAIGTNAGYNGQHANSIVISAQNTALNTANPSALYIAPIRQLTNPNGGPVNSLWWNPLDSEVCRN